MLTIATIKQQPEWVAEKLKLKFFPNPEQVIAEILEIDNEYRKILVDLESNRAELNKISKQVGIEMSKGNKDAAEEAKTQTGIIKTSISDLEKKVDLLTQQLNDLLVTLPNIPHDTVPKGKTPEENAIIFQNTLLVSLPKNAKPHWELCSEKKLIDFELGVKITGAGFPVYINKGARLQRALINFFLDQATAAGYTEIQPPVVVNADSAYATGQIPDKEGQMYFVNEDGLYLIPTAEVPITNIYRDVIVDEKDLPIKNCGYTPCFRREAGSYGAHVRGLNRLHQFDKVEIVQITKPEDSYQALEGMLKHVCNLLDLLELPYRIAFLCGGDMSFASAKTYDLEVFSAAQEKWLEVSSVSNFETFQANRLKLRYKKDKKTELLHTLNGSALALPRIMAALLENNQQADGSIKMPKILIPYLGFDSI